MQKRKIDAVNQKGEQFIIVQIQQFCLLLEYGHTHMHTHTHTHLTQNLALLTSLGFTW